MKALEMCERIVSYILLYLHDFPFHPLLALQLFTLGDPFCYEYSYDGDQLGYISIIVHIVR